MTLFDVQASGRDNDHCTGTVDGAVDVGTCAQLRRLVTSRRCQATTKNGSQCSGNAKPGSSYCWHHGG
jgi:hypothetical protein